MKARQPARKPDKRPRPSGRWRSAPSERYAPPFLASSRIFDRGRCCSSMSKPYGADAGGITTQTGISDAQLANDLQRGRGSGVADAALLDDFHPADLVQSHHDKSYFIALS